MVTSTAPATLAAPKDGRRRGVTIKDVAKATGVHFTTVSLALRDHPSLPSATKERIRAVADGMGYTPNPVFSALTHFHLRGRVRAEPMRIGYLINRQLEAETGARLRATQMLAGATEQARLLGYDLEVILVDGTGQDSGRVETTLRDRKIAGLVIAAFEPGRARLALRWDDFAVVKIDSLHMEPDALVVGSDHRYDVRLGFRRLRALGYRRIGLAVGRADEDATERLYTAGFLLEQGLVAAEERVPELLFPYDCPLADAHPLLGDWLRRHRVDAILCNWPNVVEMVRQTRLRVPEEVACASLCLLEENGLTAGVCPHPRTVGAKAVSLLTTLIKSGERGVPECASRTYVKSIWQDGASAPPKD